MVDEYGELQLGCVQKLMCKNKLFGHVQKRRPSPIGEGKWVRPEAEMT